MQIRGGARGGMVMDEIDTCIKFLKALPLYMMLVPSISNKDVLFIFSTNKAAAEEVP